MGTRCLKKKREKKRKCLLERFFEVPRVFQTFSLELRSMSGRKESSWDALEPEFYGVRCRFFALAEYSARAQSSPVARKVPSEPSIFTPLGIDTTQPCYGSARRRKYSDA